MLPADNRALPKWKTKLNRHPRPLFKAHITAMRLDNLTHKRQPQPLTSIRPMRSAFPDFFSKWVWDAWAAIRDPDRHAGPAPQVALDEGDANRSTRRRPLERVIQHIHERLPQSIPIAADEARRRRLTAQVDAC